MDSRPLLNLGAALIFALCIASPARACAQAACDAGMADRERCALPLLEAGLYALMSGSCCAASAAGECDQLELDAAEDLMATQLHGVASELRRAANSDRLLESLYAAQAAWAHYRDTQCALLVGHDASDSEQQNALHERCRFEFTIERILDLAQIHDDIEATVRRAAQLF